MALQLLQQPGAVNFAGDPIIVKAKTNLTGKTFLRIVAVCKVKAVASNESAEHSEEYSYSVGTDGIATLNVGHTVQTFLENKMEQKMQGGSLSTSLYKVVFSLALREVYLDGTLEVTGDTVQTESFTAIPGSLTEYERMSASNHDTETLIGICRILSRKPDGERIALGDTLHIPAVQNVSGSSNIAYKLTQGSTVKTGNAHTPDALVPVIISHQVTGLSNGDLSILVGGVELTRKRIVPATDDMRRFVFLNGFGLVESVTAFVRESLTYNISSESFIVPSDISYDGNTSVLNYADSPKATFAMSSGFVSRAWAEWWVNEFLPTRRAWMEVDGRYVPVAIVPEEKNQLFDRSKPGLIAVKFNVKYAFAGGTMNRFTRN